MMHAPRRWVVPVVAALVAAVVGAAAGILYVDTGTTDTQPTGTTGTGSGTWLAVTTKTAGGTSSTNSVSASTDNGHTWTTRTTTCPFCKQGNFIDGLAYGDGTWVATAQADTPGIRESATSVVFASADSGKTWTRTAALTVSLGPVAYGNGRWLALGRGNVVSGPAVASISTDGSHWTRATTRGLPGRNDLDFRVWNSIAFGGGTWVALATDCPDDCTQSAMFTSTNGRDWHRSSQVFNADATAAYGDGHWTVSGALGPCTSVGPNDVRCGASVATSNDLRHWSGSSAPASFTTINFGNGTWLLAEVSGGAEAETYTTTFFSSPDAKRWSRADTLDGRFEALAFGGS